MSDRQRQISPFRRYLLKGATCARDVHEGQTQIREPYIVNAASAAIILAELELDKYIDRAVCFMMCLRTRS